LKLLQRTNGLEDQAIYSLRLDGESDSDDGESDSDGGESDSDEREIHIASSALQRLKELHYLDVRDGIIIDGAPRCDPILSKLIVLKCGVLELSQVLVHSSLHKRLVGLKLELRDPPKEILHFRYSKLRFDGLQKRNSGLADCMLWATTNMQFYAARPIERLVEEIWQVSQLEVLELGHCRCQLLPEKFGQLVKLRRLVFQDFVNLCILPDSFGQLKALSYLELQFCHKLRSLPDSFGELCSLRCLAFLECFELDRLPASFGQLKALSYLSLSICPKLRSLPDSFGELSSLNRRDISD
jgi:hypothetical protein